MRTQQAPEEKPRTPSSIRAGGKTDEQRSSLGVEGLLAPVHAPEEKPCLKLLSSGRPSFKDQCHLGHNAFPLTLSVRTALRTSLGMPTRFQAAAGKLPAQRGRAPVVHTLRPLTVS